MQSTASRTTRALEAPDLTSSLPSVTVIVPTYNRAASLADTLRAISAQDYPAQLLDVVVVDNSSSDNTEDVVEAARAASPFAVRYYRKENRGPAASRNYAIARSCAEVLAFTDSDCTMAPDWIRTAVAQLCDGVGLVAGPRRPRQPHRPPAELLRPPGQSLAGRLCVRDGQRGLPACHHRGARRVRWKPSAPIRGERPSAEKTRISPGA